jgi:hypothetical protein
MAGKYIHKLLDLVQDISISFKALINLIKLFKSGTRLWQANKIDFFPMLSTDRKLLC